MDGDRYRRMRVAAKTHRRDPAIDGNLSQEYIASYTPGQNGMSDPFFKKPQRGGTW